VPSLFLEFFVKRRLRAAHSVYIVLNISTAHIYGINSAAPPTYATQHPPPPEICRTSPLATSFGLMALRRLVRCAGKCALKF